MSAPEVRVRVDTREHKGRTEYRWECSECGWQSNEYWVTDPEPLPSVAYHNAHCDSLALARLQARWGGRDETLRALIERWRGEAHPRHGQGLLDAADELEQALQERRHEL